MTGNDVIAVYERVLALMHDMHAAAQRSAWDELAALERDCRAAAGALIDREQTVPLAPAQAQRKSALIRQTLALDAAIRGLTEPWLRQLEAFLGTRERERRLQAAYGASELR